MEVSVPEAVLQCEYISWWLITLGCNKTKQTSNQTLNPKHTSYITLWHQVFSYIFRLISKPSSGCVRKIKDKTLTPVRLKHTKFRNIEIFTW